MEDCLYHISDHNYAYPISQDTLNLRIKVKKDYYDKITIYYKNLYDHTPKIENKEMTAILEDEYFQVFEVSITVLEKHFKYYFKLERKDQHFFYTADGKKSAVGNENFFYYPVINLDDIVELPKWAEGEIIYQVLIDRFYDGDPKNNPKDIKAPEELPDRNTYYGGDYAGLIEKMSYLKANGAKILYLSPLFSSPTYHKYDVRDYYQIDSLYGSEEELLALVKTAHEHGIKVILDCVFNHCSFENEIFQDLIKNGENSLYKNWFYPESFPVDPIKHNYDSFAGLVPSMPRFNTSNPEVIAYLTEVACYWTRKLNIDGWRLDVADEVSSRLWRELRRKLKAINNEIIIIGEVWNHASKWLQGDQFDTVTNYKYRQYLIEFIDHKLTSKQFFEKINSLKTLYKSPFYHYMVNLLGSHDTIRFITYLKKRYPSAYQKIHYISLALTLCMDGIPLIYYGDEIALEGEVDPDNRRCFLWNRINEKPVLELQKLAVLRSNSEILKKGKLLPLLCDERIIAFRREYNGKSLIVLANYTNDTKLVNIEVKEIIYGNAKILKGQVQINGYSLALLV
ncbi:MAG: glycoside hydrolase family 13 protein [Bacilli bacterium]|nr:glycoside hydrolase family 13 protein [Bacilli bacterium]